MNRKNRLRTTSYNLKNWYLAKTVENYSINRYNVIITESTDPGSYKIYSFSLLIKS